jgi:hypothetical protein
MSRDIPIEALERGRRPVIGVPQHAPVLYKSFEFLGLRAGHLTCSGTTEQLYVRHVRTAAPGEI